MDKGNKETIRLDDALKEVFAKQAEQASQLPADFSQRVAGAMMARHHKARLRTIVGWSTLGAVAACIAAVVLIQLFANPKSTPVPNESLTAQSDKGSQAKMQIKDTIGTAVLEVISDNMPTPRKVQKKEIAIDDESIESIDVASAIEELTLEESADAELITQPIQKATNPRRQDPYALTPDNIDRMIAQMATYYNVQGLELNCSNNDDLKNGTMYVLPDDENIDIIGRLYSTLLHFDTSAPNIQLIYSSEQFLFCMTSERNGKVTEDYWIAERSRGRIYLYRTRSTDDEPFSSACFFNFVAKHDRKHSNYS